MQIKMQISKIVKNEDATEETITLVGVENNAAQENPTSDFVDLTGKSSITVTNTNRNVLGKYKEGDSFFVSFIPNLSLTAAAQAAEAESNQAPDAPANDQPE